MIHQKEMDAQVYILFRERSKWNDYGGGGYTGLKTFLLYNISALRSYFRSTIKSDIIQNRFINLFIFYCHIPRYEHIF